MVEISSGCLPMKLKSDQIVHFPINPYFSEPFSHVEIDGGTCIKCENEKNQNENGEKLMQWESKSFAESIDTLILSNIPCYHSPVVIDTKVRKLSLRNCQGLSELHGSHLRKIEKLELMGFRLEEISGWEHLANLHTLQIDNSLIEYFPEELFDQDHFERLNLSNCEINLKSLPPFSKLAKIKDIQISKCSIGNTLADCFVEYVKMKTKVDQMEKHLKIQAITNDLNEIHLADHSDLIRLVKQYPERIDSTLIKESVQEAVKIDGFEIDLLYDDIEGKKVIIDVKNLKSRNLKSVKEDRKNIGQLRQYIPLVQREWNLGDGKVRGILVTTTASQHICDIKHGRPEIEVVQIGVFVRFNPIEGS